MSVINGTVAFANLNEHEVFNGQSTGKYSLVVVLDDPEAEKLEGGHQDQDVQRIKPQRKFTTKFEDFPVIDNDGEPVSKSLCTLWGDKVRIKYNLGNPHPVHGVAPYLQAIRVVEKGEMRWT
jgi:hypothetical protein